MVNGKKLCENMRVYGQVNMRLCENMKGRGSSGKMAKRHEDDVHNVPGRHKQYRHERIYQSQSLQTLHKTVNISFKTLRIEFAMNIGFINFSSPNACFPKSNTLQSCS